MTSEKTQIENSIQRRSKGLQSSSSSQQEYGKVRGMMGIDFRDNGYGNQVVQSMNYGYGGTQLKNNKQDENIQMKQDEVGGSAKYNNTGLPDHLKSGIESLSGKSLNDVKVHYNSDKPAQMQAHAYAKGTDIHIASGQEKHLPHEAWHVVQQKQGRVKPTLQLKEEINVNDDDTLEKEADLLGGKASQMGEANKLTNADANSFDADLSIKASMPGKETSSQLSHDIVQMHKCSVQSKSNLRSINHQTQYITADQGEEIEIIEPIESKRFSAGDFISMESILGFEIGPWHTKVCYKDKIYWINNLNLIGRDDREITEADFINLPLNSSNDVIPQISFSDSDSSLGQSGTFNDNLKGKEKSVDYNLSTSKNIRSNDWIPQISSSHRSGYLGSTASFNDDLKGKEKTQAINIGNVSSMDITERLKLGEYFEPRVAPVENGNEMGFAGGGDIAYDQGLKGGFNWEVHTIGGMLCNHKGDPITGQGAWVLGKDRQLYGSQATELKKSESLFKFPDMDSHQMAPVSAAYWAGDMHVVNGKVIKLNNQSGTYHLEAESNANILIYLILANVISLKEIGNGKIQIYKWIQTGIDREGKLFPMRFDLPDDNDDFFVEPPDENINMEYNDDFEGIWED